MYVPNPTDQDAAVVRHRNRKHITKGGALGGIIILAPTSSAPAPSSTASTTTAATTATTTATSAPATTAITADATTATATATTTAAATVATTSLARLVVAKHPADQLKLVPPAGWHMLTYRSALLSRLRPLPPASLSARLGREEARSEAALQRL